MFNIQYFKFKSGKDSLPCRDSNPRPCHQSGYQAYTLPIELSLFSLYYTKLAQAYLAVANNLVLFLISRSKKLKELRNIFIDRMLVQTRVLVQTRESSTQAPSSKPAPSSTPATSVDKVGQPVVAGRGRFQLAGLPVQSYDYTLPFLFVICASQTYVISQLNLKYYYFF